MDVTVCHCKNSIPVFCLCAGGGYVFFCGVCQYANMFGTGIGYTITASASAA